ncbi:hypothetical protein POM88_028825 [Heracleum sosnowskyi]|uniref:Uncharacterized protein n=1 Tax=Heracleum sosnowskyi TaxID=360622 RepID=A0AAD8MH32_9APIA|nr:hypothetical protein POM88_028825 [Heracleum sosnowskyi]
MLIVLMNFVVRLCFLSPNALMEFIMLADLLIFYSSYMLILGKCYLFKKVLKAMTEPEPEPEPEPVVGIIYYITFQVSLPADENAGTVRAKVLVKFPDPTTEMDMVRKINKV